MMDRYNKIIENDLFIQYMAELEELEKDRIYCRHGMDHLVNVAHIAYIKYLEDSKKFQIGIISKDIIYAVALLHDIGRVKEYTMGMAHDEASSVIASKILPECGYNSSECELICKVITNHRGFEEEACGDFCESNDKAIIYLSSIIKYADKNSRRCMDCKAWDMCKWPEDKKNRGIV